LTELKKGNVDASLLGEFLGVEGIPTLGQGVNRPEIFEVIMVIIAKDCNKNADKYTPRKEQEEEWNNYIHHGFMGDIPDSHEAINQIIETANIMAFE
jgi:hypothetical protein